MRREGEPGSREGRVQESSSEREVRIHKFQKACEAFADDADDILGDVMPVNHSPERASNVLYGFDFSPARPNDLYLIGKFEVVKDKYGESYGVVPPVAVLHITLDSNGETTVGYVQKSDSLDERFSEKLPAAISEYLKNNS